MHFIRLLALITKMKIVSFLTLLFCSIIVNGQNKDIFIKTNKLLLKRLNFDLFSEPSEIGFNELDYQIDQVILGKVKIYFYTNDTICFRINRDLPIMITGLKNLKTNKVVIRNIPSINYNPIDSIWTYSVQYFDQDSLDLSTEKTTINVPNNSEKFELKIKNLKINNISYSSSIISLPYEGDSWYCTPGKFSTHQYIKKVDKFYLFEIKEE